MMHDSLPKALFHERIMRVLPFSRAWGLVAVIFGIHAVIRFSGLWNALFIPVSMLIIWPLPWLLSSAEARKKMGFQLPSSAVWWMIGPAVSLVMLGICFLAAWLFFGDGDNNWLVQHAVMLNEALAPVPAETSWLSRYLIVTAPAVLFSPLGEEFLYRGYMQTAFTERWNFRVGMLIQALAFALVHLAHYGLNPIQPVLLLVWLPSMFFAALMLGWIVKQSRSIWVGVCSHAVFNAGMNMVVFLWFPV